MQTIGVIADTHIPDRGRKIHPEALEAFRKAKVDLILHAGDLSVRRVLSELDVIAPVLAVRGNVDLLILSGLPRQIELEIEGVKIGMTHGHGTFWQYVQDKIIMYLRGPHSFSFFQERARNTFPDADVVVLGHNHAPLCKQVGKQLIFNPGSPTVPNHNSPNPQQTVGLLHIDNGTVLGEIIVLDKMKL